MSLYANQLKCGSECVEMNQIVQDHLRTIDGRIQENVGTYNLRHELPNIFPGVPLNRKVAQIRFYHDILQSLENRGFIVTIDIKSANTTFLQVRWMSDDEKDRIEAMTSFIRDHKEAPEIPKK